MENYYQLLGLPVDATAEEIKQRCLELGQAVRPDKHGEGSAEREQFEEIERAFVALTNPDSRAAYDTLLIGEATLKRGMTTDAYQEMEPWWMRPNWKRFVGGFSIIAGLGIVGNIIWISPGVQKTGFDPSYKFPPAQANMDANCSANAIGHVSCAFSNHGQKEGSICVQIQLAKRYDSRSRPIISDDICSGVVAASDVRDRTVMK